MRLATAPQFKMTALLRFSLSLALNSPSSSSQSGQEFALFAIGSNVSVPEVQFVQSDFLAGL
jgi:hypothetical protein